MANELEGLSLEEQERQKAEWSVELAKVSLSVGLAEKREEDSGRPEYNSRIATGGGGDTDPETRPRQQGQDRAGSEKEVGYQRVEGAHRRRQSGPQECQGESSVRIPPFAIASSACLLHFVHSTHSLHALYTAVFSM